MKRPFAVIGFSVFAALLFGSFSNKTINTAVMIITAALFILTFTPIKPLRNPVFSLCLISVSLAIGLYQLAALPDYNSALALDGREAAVTGRVIEEKEVKYGRSYYIIETDSISLPSAPQKLKIRLSASPELDIEPFSKISTSLYLYAPADKYGFSSQSSYRSKGIYLFGRAIDGVDTVAPPSKVPYYYAIKLRSACRERINEYCTGSTSAYLRAICLGEEGALPDDSYRNLRNAGVVHLFVVSGLHLSVITGALFFIFRKLRLSQRRSAVLTLPAVILFVLLSGLSPSILRAGIMNVIFLLSRIFFRRSDPLNSLGLAAFLMLAANPFAVQNISFLLSFFASLGIISAAGRLTLKNPPKHFSVLASSAYSIFAQTVCANIFTFPVSVIVFGFIGVFAVPANILIALPATLLLILGFVFIAFSFTGIGFLIKPIAFAAQLICNYIDIVSSSAGGSGYSVLRLENKIYLLALGLSFILIGIAAAAFKSRRHIEYAILISALIFSFSFAADRIKSKDTLSLRVLNVESGFSAVLYGEDTVSVIGCGGKGLSDVTLKNELLSEKIDIFFLPRNDTAFAGNAKSAINELSPKNILISSFGDSLDYDIIKEKGIKVIPPGGRITAKGVTADFYDSEKVSALAFNINGSKLLFLSNRADLSCLPASMTDCDLILCSAAPRNLSFVKSPAALISNSSKTGQKEAAGFTDAGIPVFLTSDNGDITLTFTKDQIEINAGM